MAEEVEVEKEEDRQPKSDAEGAKSTPGLL
jgi:hypothetical protein